MNRQKLHGFSPTTIAKEANISRASVYNWLNGRGPYVGLIIQPVIEKLLKTKEEEESDSDGLRQKLELEKSIQNSN